MHLYDRHAITERHAELDFSLLLPPGWRVELPPQPQFAHSPSSSANWVELARAGAPRGSPMAGAVLIVAGLERCGFDSLQQALGHLLRQGELAREQLQPLRMGRHVGLSMTARTGTPRRPLKARVALIEDGGRLLRLMLVAAPDNPALESPLWSAVAGGLVLHVRNGSTLPALQPVQSRPPWPARRAAVERQPVAA